MRKPTVSLDADQLRLLSSPVRLAIHTAVRADGPSSAKEIAVRLGMEETSIYYHLRLMAAKGLLTTGARPTATKPEAVYDEPGPLILRRTAMADEATRREVCRNVDSLMRAAAKEYRAGAEALGQGAYERSLIGRTAVRLSRSNFAELRRRLRDLRQWAEMHSEDGKPRYSVTFAVAPIMPKGGSGA